MVHIAIVEDEEIYLKQIREYLERYQRENNFKIKISEFLDGEDILEQYAGNYDIILMDIKMRWINGMTAARQIRMIDPAVIIIFITNLVQYAVQGYEVNALQYIVKPVEYFPLSRVLNQALEKIENEKARYILVQTDMNIQRFKVSDVYYIESQGHTLIYHTKSGEYRTTGSIKDVEKSIESDGFFCCSRGILVNIACVDSVEENTCTVGGTRIPVSRRKKKEFMQQILHFANGVI